jgi:YD repeat-containing protein
VTVQLQAEREKEGREQQMAWEGRGKRVGRTQLREGRRQQKEGRTQLLEGRKQLLEGRRQASIHQLRQIDCPDINVFSFFPMGFFLAWME